MLLGGLLISYAFIELLGYTARIPIKLEGAIGTFCGAFTGLLTGMTGSCVFPGVLYLQAIGLQREVMVQTMGVMFTCTTLALALSLYENNFLNLENSLWSNLGIIPALFGMMLGKIIRMWLPQDIFRYVFFVSILLLGAYIIFQALNNV